MINTLLKLGENPVSAIPQQVGIKKLYVQSDRDIEIIIWWFSYRTPYRPEISARGAIWVRCENHHIITFLLYTKRLIPDRCVQSHLVIIVHKIDCVPSLFQVEELLVTRGGMSLSTG